MSLAHSAAPLVLVVDDETTICRALTIALRRAGYDARTAETAEAAQMVLQTQVVDAMIVDLLLPDQRGDILFEVAAALQPHLRTATLFTTGDTSERAFELIVACGTPLLIKPFDLGEMIGIVDQVTRRARDASA